MSNDVDTVISKLKHALEENEEITIFNKTEVETLRRVVVAVQWLEGFGKLGKILLWLLITLAAASTAINQLREGAGQ